MGQSLERCCIRQMLGDATSCMSKCCVPCFPDQEIDADDDEALMKGRRQADAFVSGCVFDPSATVFANVAARDCTISDGQHTPIQCRVYTNRVTDVTSRRVALLFIHGGGFVFGSLAGYDNVCAALSHVTGFTIVYVEYRRAPEAPFPAALIECYRTLMWMRDGQHDFEWSTVGVVGDSAGANLSAAVCRLASTLSEEGSSSSRRRIDDQLEVPESLRAVLPELTPQTVDCMCIVCPVTDADADSADANCWRSSYMIKRKSMASMWRMYECGRRCHLTHLIGTDDHAHMPRTLMLLAECDSLRPQGEEYGRLLKASGVDVQVVTWPRMHHAFFVMYDYIPQSRQAMLALRAFVLKSPPPSPPAT